MMQSVRLERVVQRHRDRSEKGGLSLARPDRDEKDPSLTSAAGDKDGVSLRPRGGVVDLAAVCAQRIVSCPDSLGIEEVIDAP